MAIARGWQLCGNSHEMAIAGLPSDHVMMVALVRVSGSLPGTLLGSLQATPSAAIPIPDSQRTTDRAIICVLPLLARRHYMAPTGSYSVAEASHFLGEVDEAARLFVVDILRFGARDRVSGAADQRAAGRALRRTWGDLGPLRGAPQPKGGRSGHDQGRRRHRIARRAATLRASRRWRISCSAIACP